MAKNKLNSRIFKDRIFVSILLLIGCICALPLMLILFFIVKQGINSISLQFLTQLPKPVGEQGGGVLNAIVGSLMLISMAAVISIPIGIMGGIYLSERKHTKVANLARSSAEILQGIPSIVVGIIAYLWIVKPMGHFSALSGGIALGFMMLPVILRTTEETLNLIPNSIKEASLALGVPYYKTILRIILPCGISGIMSGIIISLARVAGETAPLLFTAFGNPYLNTNANRPVQSLPLIIFNYATSPYDDWKQQAWGASFLLLSFILIISVTAKLLTRRWKVQF